VFFVRLQVISYDSQRGGVSVITEKGDITTSYLLIQNADLADSGRYSCSPSNADVASVRVHVLNGNLKFPLYFCSYCSPSLVAQCHVRSLSSGVSSFASFIVFVFVWCRSCHHCHAFTFICETQRVKIPLSFRLFRITLANLILLSFLSRFFVFHPKISISNTTLLILSLFTFVLIVARARRAMKMNDDRKKENKK
jgi:hypothetical protein